MARARIELGKRNVDAAVNDLDVVDRTAPREANLRLDLGGLYYEAKRYDIGPAASEVLPRSLTRRPASPGAATGA